MTSIIHATDPANTGYSLAVQQNSMTVTISEPVAAPAYIAKVSAEYFFSSSGAIYLTIYQENGNREIVAHNKFQPKTATEKTEAMIAAKESLTALSSLLLQQGQTEEAAAVFQRISAIDTSIQALIPGAAKESG